MSLLAALRSNSRDARTRTATQRGPASAGLDVSPAAPEAALFGWDLCSHRPSTLSWSAEDKGSVSGKKKSEINSYFFLILFFLFPPQGVWSLNSVGQRVRHEARQNSETRQCQRDCFCSVIKLYLHHVSLSSVQHLFSSRRSWWARVSLVTVSAAICVTLFSDDFLLFTLFCQSVNV